MRPHLWDVTARLLLLSDASIRLYKNINSCTPPTSRLLPHPNNSNGANTPATDPRGTIPPNSRMDQNALKGKKPNRVLPVPPEFRRPCRARERDAIVHDIKIKTGCTVIPHWDYQQAQGEGIISQFDIFGAGAGLERATHYIQEWIAKASRKSKESSAWAKTPAFDVNKWYAERIEELELERKQIFKGPPPQPHECEPPLHMVSLFSTHCDSL